MNGITSEQKVQLAAVYFFTAFLFFVGLAGRDLWNPDEPRYAEVAREMRVMGDWMLPHLNGEVYPDKPPGFFWLINVSSLLLGDDGNIAAKVPSAVLSLGTLLLVYLLARDLFGHRAGVISAFVLGTNFQFLWLSQRANIDASLTFFTTLAIFAFFRGYFEKKGKGAWYLLFFISIAAATLIKGPVGFIVPSLVALFTVLKREGYKGLRFKYLLWGVPLFAAIDLAWLVPACMHGGETYARTLLLHHVVQRFESAWTHRQPFYYYLHTFPTGFVPYSFLIPAALYQFFKRDSVEEKSRLWFPAIWFLVIFIFFSISSSKRELYLLPLYPAAAMIIGRFLDKIIDHERSAANRWLFVPLLILFLLLVVGGLGYSVAPFAHHKLIGSRLSGFPKAQAQLAASLEGWGMLGCVICGLFLLSAAVWGARGCFKKNCRQTISALLTLAAAFSLTISLSTVRIGNSFKSGRPLGETIRQVVGPSDDLICFDEDEPAINLYSGKIRIPNVEDVNEFMNAMNSEKRTFAVIARGDYERMKWRFAEPPVIVEEFLFGHHAGYLIANKAAAKVEMQNADFKMQSAK